MTFTVAGWRADAVQESWRLRFGPGSVKKGWAGRAACLGVQTALFYDPCFADAARAVCVGCPVRLDCLHEAFNVEQRDGDDIYGMFGGLTPAERIERLDVLVVLCGTKEGYRRHLARDETACDDCKGAHAADRAERRRRARSQLAVSA